MRIKNQKMSLEGKMGNIVGSQRNLTLRQNALEISADCFSLEEQRLL